MLDQIANDTMDIINSVFLSGDVITAVIAVVVAVIFAFLMSSYSSVVGTTIGALIVFVIAQYARTVVQGGEGVTWESTLESYWRSFMDLSMGTFLVYFIAFLVVISIFYAIRQAISR